MYIFIDEAGGFIVPDSKDNLVSCVGALIIPESLIENVFKSFQDKKIEMGFGNDEVKGSRLNESQIASIIDLLSNYDLIFEVTAIDLALHSDDEISKHKLLQADLITENVTDKFHPQLIRDLEELQQQYKILSNQLYVQSVCMSELFFKMLQKSTLYYSQRLPNELENFYWFIDAKDKELTPYENQIKKIVCPALQDISRKKPFIQLTDADYSYFQKYLKTSPTPPEHLKKAFGNVSPFYQIEINDIFRKNFHFEQSKQNLGIQLIDILVTSIRRAMNNNLQIQGWGKIGALMVQSDKTTNTIQLVSLNNMSKTKVPYFHVIDITNQTCKSMFKNKH